MKRQLKFRGKKISTNEWRACTSIETTFDGTVLIGYEEVDPASVGQYTGLKDNKGNEIYEGDILKSKDAKIIVEWNNYKCGFNITEYGLHLFEKIGNIYDNIELIK